jgi:predicted Zn-dependent protease
VVGVPSFTDATGGLGSAYFMLGLLEFLPPTDAFEQARHAGEMIVKSDPKLAYGHEQLGSIHVVYDWDWAAADRELKLAVAFAPNDNSIYQNAAGLSIALGRWDEALSLLNASLALDPLDPTCYSLLSQVEMRRGHLAEAEAAARRTLEFSPTFTFGHYQLGLVLLARNELQAALAESLMEGDDSARLAGSAMAYFALGRRADSDIALAQMVKSHANRPFRIAELYAYRGELDEAIKWLDRAYLQKDVNLYHIKGELPFAKLEGDPRYKAFLKKMNLPE